MKAALLSASNGSAVLTAVLMLPVVFTLASIWLMTMLMQVLLAGGRLILYVAFKCLVGGQMTCMAKHVGITRSPVSSTCISIVMSNMLARVKIMGQQLHRLCQAKPHLQATSYWGTGRGLNNCDTLNAVHSRYDQYDQWIAQRSVCHGCLGPI